jgi:hypothetical protein
VSEHSWQGYVITWTDRDVATVLRHVMTWTDRDVATVLLAGDYLGQLSPLGDPETIAGVRLRWQTACDAYICPRTRTREWQHELIDVSKDVIRRMVGDALNEFIDDEASA